MLRPSWRPTSWCASGRHMVKVVSKGPGRSAQKRSSSTDVAPPGWRRHSVERLDTCSGASVGRVPDKPGVCLGCCLWLWQGWPAAVWLAAMCSRRARPAAGSPPTTHLEAAHHWRRGAGKIGEYGGGIDTAAGEDAHAHGHLGGAGWRGGRVGGGAALPALVSKAHPAPHTCSAGLGGRVAVPRQSKSSRWRTAAAEHSKTGSCYRSGRKVRPAGHTVGGGLAAHWRLPQPHRPAASWAGHHQNHLMRPAGLPHLGKTGVSGVALAARASCATCSSHVAQARLDGLPPHPLC